MSTPKRYNGHHCWNCWNVALWIGNDEGLYRFALDCRQRSKTIGDATRWFLNGVDSRTPDGARYTVQAVRSALAGLE